MLTIHRFFFPLYYTLAKHHPIYTAISMPSADLRNRNENRKGLSLHKYWEVSQVLGAERGMRSWYVAFSGSSNHSSVFWFLTKVNRMEFSTNYSLSQELSNFWIHWKCLDFFPKKKKGGVGEEDWRIISTKIRKNNFFFQCVCFRCFSPLRLFFYCSQ